MEEPAEFEDWELLHSSDPALFLPPNSADDSKPSEEIEAESDDSRAIKSDYFTLDSGERYAKRADGKSCVSEGEGLVISGNPSWVNPNLGSRCLDRPRGELGFAVTGFSCEDSDGFRSDVLPEDQSSLSDNKKDEHNQNFLPVSGKGELYHADDSKTEVGFEGIIDVHQTSDESSALKEAGSGETEEIGGSETRDEKANELGSGESGRREDSTCSLAGTCDGNSTSDNPLPCEGVKKGILWLKLPLDLLKFCVLRVRPVWSISIAATIVGIVMLGRRLYKMKHKSRNIALKVRIDDKKASQFMVRAARLNEAFSVVRRVPIAPPAIGVTPWPAVGLL